MLLDSTKLRKFRDSKRISQEELAEDLGISQSTISEWERTDSNVKLEHLINLSRIFEVGLDELTAENSSIIYINNQNNNK